MKLLISIMFAKVQPAAGVVEKRFLSDGPAADTYLQVFFVFDRIESIRWGGVIERKEGIKRAKRDRYYCSSNR